MFSMILLKIMMTRYHHILLHHHHHGHYGHPHDLCRTCSNGCFNTSPSPPYVSTVNKDIQPSNNKILFFCYLFIASNTIKSVASMLSTRRARFLIRKFKRRLKLLENSLFVGIMFSLESLEQTRSASRTLY